MPGRDHIPLYVSVIAKQDRQIILATVVRYIGRDTLLIAIDGKCNPRPATISDKEILAKKSVVINGRRQCVLPMKHPSMLEHLILSPHTPFRAIVDENGRGYPFTMDHEGFDGENGWQLREDGLGFVVESESRPRACVKTINRATYDSCVRTQGKLLEGDEQAMVLTDLLLSKGIMAPEGQISAWTLGDLFPVAHSLEMIETNQWSFADCVEDLEELCVEDSET